MEQLGTGSTSPKPRPREWGRAWRALRNLVADPERTDQVFEIIRAMSGNSFERAYRRFLKTPEARTLLRDRPSLLDTLSDRAALLAMPAASFGRAYATFMQAGQLEAGGLVEAERMADDNYPPEQRDDPDREFFGERLRDMHDLWHVLTGYGRDEAGEAANLAFTLGQVWNPGIAFIVVAGAVLGPKDLSLAWPRYLFRAWRRGRRAALLTCVPYEQLLARPLDEVRAALAIEPPAVAHPNGIVVANRGEEPGVATA